MLRKWAFLFVSAAALAAPHVAQAQPKDTAFWVTGRELLTWCKYERSFQKLHPNAVESGWLPSKPDIPTPQWLACLSYVAGVASALSGTLPLEFVKPGPEADNETLDHFSRAASASDDDWPTVWLRVHCASSHVTTEQMVLVVTGWMENNPAKLHLPASTLAILALKDEFPCPSWKPEARTTTVLPGAASPRQSRGMTRRIFRAIQEDLATLGYDPGPADGIPGPRTRAAIRAFQRDQGLAVTGEASADLADRLFAERHEAGE